MGKRTWPWRRKRDLAMTIHTEVGADVEVDPDNLPDMVERSRTSEIVGDEQVTTVRAELGDTGLGLTVTIGGPAPDTTNYVRWNWARSAPQPTGPTYPPDTALAVAPGLDVVLSDVPEPDLPHEARNDWPVSATLPELHVDEAEWCDADTELVAAALTDDLDSYMRALIDTWEGQWVDRTQFGRLLDRFPDFAARLEDQHRNEPRYSRKRDAHRNKWVEWACTAGLWSIYRQRHPWPDPVARDCVVCGRTFPPEGLWGSELDYGPSIACKACSRRAMFGHELTTLDVKTLLRNITDVLGFPPPSAFRNNRELVALSPNSADLLALLVALPVSMTCSRTLGVNQKGAGRWLATLQAAGVVGEAWKMQRGVMTLADDGHLCRSMGELAVERYLIAHDIEHETEPEYPEHPSLNPGGRKRADWLLPGDFWVEYAGMMEDNAYAKKMHGKVQLAQDSGLNLLVLTPDDLPRLGEVLAAAGVR